MSDEWYTPLWLLDAIGNDFDLDPCSPDGGLGHVVARERYTMRDDGLSKDWGGRYVFMNPPFGGRCGHLPWFHKFIKNGNGVGVANALTSSGWFHEITPQMGGVLFPKGKTKFEKPDGTTGKSPVNGVVLYAIGDRACAALRESGVGIYLTIEQNPKGQFRLF